jgi:Uma2 family endonuclease
MTSTTAKRFTIDEYHRLADLGFFTEDDRVELIRGEIMQMAAKGTPHTNCCRDLLEELAGLLIGRAKLQCQDPIVLLSNSDRMEFWVLTLFPAQFAECQKLCIAQYKL